MQLICNDIVPPGWDKWQSEAGLESGFCQTTARAHMHGLLHGSSPLYLCVECHGQRLAAAQLLISPVDPDKSGAGVRIFCDEGPVLHGDPEALDLILAGILDIARGRNASTVRVRSPVLASWVHDGNDIPALDAYACNPWLTSVVDISADEASLFASLERSIRKSIRKCRKLGILVHACRSADEFIASFLLPYYSANGQSLGHEQQDRYRDWWEIAKGSGYLFLYATDQQGIVLATLGSVGFAGLATEVMSARMPESYSINASPQDLLHWESFCHHARLGCRYFNLAGFNPDPVSDKEQGIRRYKEKWPGQIRDYPLYTREQRGLRSRLAGVLRPVCHRLFPSLSGKSV